METKNKVLEFKEPKAFITYEFEGDLELRRAIYDFTSIDDLFYDLNELFKGEKLIYFTFSIL